MSIIAKRRTVSEAGIEWQPTEEQEQAAVIEWRELMKYQFPELKLLIHIPNGGLRSKSEAVRFKRLGVRPGVSDLFLPVARGGFHGLWVELKRKKGGRVSKEQRQWIDDMLKEGYLCDVCHGAEEACDTIYKYLTENEQ